MHPKVLPLKTEYYPELLDPKHRVLSISQVLYERWQYLEATKQITVDFATWANQQDDKYDSKVLYIKDIEELAKYRVYINAQGLAERRIANYLYSQASSSSSLLPQLTLEAELLNCEIERKREKLPLALVMPAADSLLYAISLRRNQTHHSTLSAGRDVYFTATAFAEEGKFISISNKSGHYKPDLYSFVFGLNSLCAQGADLTNTNILLIIPIEKNSYSDEELRSYANGKIFVDLYATHGFEHKNYQGMFDTLKDAKQKFIFDMESTNSEAVFFIKEDNDLYTFKREALVDTKDQLSIKSFADQYQEKLVEYLKTRERLKSLESASKNNSTPLLLNFSRQVPNITPISLRLSPISLIEEKEEIPEAAKEQAQNLQQPEDDSWQPRKKFKKNLDFHL